MAKDTGFSFNIENFKEKFRLGGARPNLFRVQIDLAANGEPGVPNHPAETKLTFTCRAASIPAETVGTIEVPYFGRKIKVAGDRTFAEWTVTIINDEDWQVRRAFERWNNKINLMNENVRIDPYKIQGSGVESYKRDAVVYQYDKKGDIIAAYRFTGMFPNDIGAIDLAWDTTDTIEEFPVTLQYDYWVTDDRDPGLTRVE